MLNGAAHSRASSASLIQPEEIKSICNPGSCLIDLRAQIGTHVCLLLYSNFTLQGLLSFQEGRKLVIAKYNCISLLDQSEACYYGEA